MKGLKGVRRATGGVLAVFALAAIACSPPAASAAGFGIVPGGFSIRTIDAEGNPVGLAGSHPDRLQIDFALNVEGTGTTARDLEFDLPAGLGSDPSAVPPCPRDLFEAGEEECPAESQVGVLALGPTGSQTTLPIFVVEPEPGEIAGFGSRPGVDLPLEMDFRPGDFGVTMKANDLPQVALSEGRVELWGVPADRQEGTSIPRRPFLTTPTVCGPMVVAFRTRSWEDGAPWLSASDAVSLSGCEDLRFAPRLDWQLTTPVADSPTGVRIGLAMPEEADPDGRAGAQIENAIIQLPAGITVSPGGAVALAACSDAQLAVLQMSEPACPASSRVGTVELASSLLREPLRGDIYLGEGRSGEPFRFFIAASGLGIVMKFTAGMRADPSTGRLSMTLSDLPQAPLTHLSLNMDGGSRALLASPLECGPSTLVGRFEAHGGAVVEASNSVSIGAGSPSSSCPGPGPFAPTFEITRSSTRAGRPTTLSTRLLRRAGEQLPGRFTMALPSGLSAALGSLEPCPESGTASGDCPAASRVGDAVVKIGSGPDLVSLRGDVYLTGPYRRAPFGLLMVSRAAIGPFDFGAMVVRMALHLDRHTGRVTVASDRLPAAFEGVPTRFRSVELHMDRKGFIVNPTSCAPSLLEAVVEAPGGASVSVNSPFAVTGCNRLGFKPRISMSLVGRSELHRGGNPGLRVATRFRSGDSNLRALSMTFPRIFSFNFSAAKEICARRDAIENECPPGSRVGAAYVRTPLLGKRLRGSMFVAQPKGDGLPDLWFSVADEGVQISMRGQTSVRDGRLAIKLGGLPDMALSSLTMRTPGGEEGMLVLGEGLCVDGHPRRLALTARIKAQAGAGRLQRVPVRARPRCAS